MGSLHLPLGLAGALVRVLPRPGVERL